MRHIQAANFTPVHRREINLLVIHDMEYPEKITAAEDVANFFKNQKKGPTGSSAHVCVDENSAVSCVWDHDVAWAAPGANHNGWHCEFAGYSKQNRKQWDDDYSVKMLMKVAAPIFAHKALRYDIPVNLLEATDIKRGRTGVTAHIFITEAYPNLGSHKDPGLNFPFTEFLSEVRFLKKWLRDR